MADERPKQDGVSSPPVASKKLLTRRTPSQLEVFPGLWVETGGFNEHGRVPPEWSLSCYIYQSRSNKYFLAPICGDSELDSKGDL